MNRKNRRAEQASTRKAEVEPGTAYHEAGHAIARLLTASVMGYEPRDAVQSIEVNPGSYGTSRDGRMHLVSQAICMGPMVSEPLQRALAQAIDLKPGVAADVVWGALPTIGTYEERQTCMRSRMLIDVMGAAAETRYLARSDPGTLFSTYACEDDRLDFARNCRVLEIDSDAIAELEGHFLRHARMLAERPIIWSAIESVAKRVRATMSGRLVWQLAWPLLSTDTEAINAPLPA